jgi:hypothetical protein
MGGVWEMNLFPIKLPTEYARMACDSLTSPSPIRNWYQEKHRLTLENSKFFADNPKTSMALRKYIASQFRPTAALAIYKIFNAKSVYDPYKELMI